MSENPEITYRYRRWPFLLPVYAVFAIVYSFLVYSGEELSYGRIAETAVMTLFFLSPLAPAFFDLRIKKVSHFGDLAKSLVLSFFLSLVLMLLLMLSYLRGEAWFGALALLFFYLIYNALFFPVAYMIFRVSLRAKKNDYA